MRDIHGHLEDLYGVDVSPDLISRVSSAVVEDVLASQARPLDPVYPMVYLDALVVKVRDQGVVKNKSVYLALAVTLHGGKEVLVRSSQRGGRSGSATTLRSSGPPGAVGLGGCHGTPTTSATVEGDHRSRRPRIFIGSSP